MTQAEALTKFISIIVVGREGAGGSQGPLGVESWHFSITLLAKKVVFLFS